MSLVSKKVFLKLKTSVAYSLLKSELVKTESDLEVIGGDESRQKIHKDLLRCVSSRFCNALAYSKEKGHDPGCLGAIKVPGLDELGLKCLHDLLYKGFHVIDSTKADEIIRRLNNLDLSLSYSYDHKEDWTQNDSMNNDSSESTKDSSWSNRLRVRKRKTPTSSSTTTDDDQLSMDTTPTPTNPTPSPITTTPCITSTVSSTTTISTASSRITDSPPTPPTPTRTTRRKSAKLSSSEFDNDEPNAISQEDRDIQRITSVIKSFLPHPACFLVEDGNLECFVCGEIFRYRDNWRRHLLEQHFHLTFLCPACGQKFKRRGKCSEHMSRCR